MVILSRFSPKDSVFLQFVWFSLHEVSLRWTVGKKFEINFSRLPENAFPTLFLTVEVYLHSLMFPYMFFLFAAAAIFVGILEFYGRFSKKLTRNIHKICLYTCL